MTNGHIKFMSSEQTERKNNNDRYKTFRSLSCFISVNENVKRNNECVKYRTRLYNNKQYELGTHMKGIMFLKKRDEKDGGREEYIDR